MADNQRQDAEFVREPNRCDVWHRAHNYQLFPWMSPGYWVRACAFCGLTETEVQAARIKP